MKQPDISGEVRTNLNTKNAIKCPIDQRTVELGLSLPSSTDHTMGSMRTIGIALKVDQDYRDKFSESTHTAWKHRKAMMARPLTCQRSRRMTGGLCELLEAVLHLIKEGQPGTDTIAPAEVCLTALFAFRHGFQFFPRLSLSIRYLHCCAFGRVSCLALGKSG